LRVAAGDEEEEQQEQDEDNIRRSLRPQASDTRTADEDQCEEEGEEGSEHKEKTHRGSDDAADEHEEEKKSQQPKSMPRSDVAGVYWHKFYKTWRVDTCRKRDGKRLQKNFKPKDQSAQEIDKARELAEAHRKNLQTGPLGSRGQGKLATADEGDSHALPTPAELLALQNAIPKGEGLTWNLSARVLKVSCWYKSRSLQAALRPESYDQQGLEQLLARARKLRMMLAKVGEELPTASHREIVQEARRRCGEPETKGPGPK